MSETRNITRVLRSQPVIEGAGVHLKRAFGFHDVTLCDPFLMLDDFRNSDPARYKSGFPWHPHRGIETITYVLRGTVEHGDSMGNTGIIGPGDVQWMTAGSGIVHQEMPEGDAQGVQWGFQLWANLPASRKMMDPRYQEITSDQIPEAVLDNGVSVRVICGRAAGQQGPVRDIVIEPEFLDVTLPPHTEFLHPTPPGHTVLAYVIDDRGYFCRDKKPFTFEREAGSYTAVDNDPSVADEHLVVFGPGDEVVALAGDQSLRFLLISGKPLREPVAWRGPIVMNTQEELRIAFEEYAAGTFIKSGKKI